MRIQKAVITAAGPAQRALPLQTLIDRDGQEKPVLSILIEQALAAGVQEICVVVWPGDESRYVQAAGPHASAIRFVAQAEPKGYADAILCARGFTGAEVGLVPPPVIGREVQQTVQSLCGHGPLHGME